MGMKNPPASYKRRWNLSTRYGITPEAVDAMREAQGGVCGICAEAMKRECIDHCHDTGKVRGLLCHRCNVVLHGLENADYRAKATAYLERTK